MLPQAASPRPMSRSSFGGSAVTEQGHGFASIEIVPDANVANCAGSMVSDRINVEF